MNTNTITKSMRNKRGGIIDLITWVIISFIVIMFLGVWMYGHGILTTSLVNLQSTGSVNYSEAALQTFGQVNDAMVGFHFLAAAIIFGLMLSILITSYFMKQHPIFFIVHVLVIIVTVIFSVSVSNAYEKLLTNSVLGSTLQDFTAANWIMLNLPTWVVVIGLIGALILFAGMPRDRELSGGGI